MSGTTSNPTYYVTVSKQAEPDTTIRIDRMGELVAFDTADPTSTLTGRSGFLGYLSVPDSVVLSPDDPSATAQVDYLHVLRGCATSDLEPDGTTVWAAVLVKLSINGGPPELFATTPREVRVTDNLVRLTSSTGAGVTATPQPTPVSRISAPTPTSGTRTPAAGSTLPLPTFVRASHEYTPQALAQGVLTRDSDGCVRIGPGGPVAVWPAGYTASVDRSGIVRIIAPDGEVTRTGQRVAATGGFFQAETPGCSTTESGGFNVFLLEIK